MDGAVRLQVLAGELWSVWAGLSLAERRGVEEFLPGVGEALIRLGGLLGLLGIGSGDVHKQARECSWNC